MITGIEQEAAGFLPFPCPLFLGQGSKLAVVVLAAGYVGAQRVEIGGRDTPGLETACSV
jgi:hypothetical protein